jgi:hypothetical protein
MGKPEIDNPLLVAVLAEGVSEATSGGVRSTIFALDMSSMESQDAIAQIM